MIAATHSIRRIRAVLPLVGAIACLAAAVACGDDNNNLIVTPLPIAGVTTFHDASFNFATLSTFSMPDTIVHLVSAGGTVVDISRSFDQATLAQVRADLLARGYTQAAPGTLPSFVVLVGVTGNANYTGFVSYPWFTFWGFSPIWVFDPAFNAGWSILYPYGLTGVTTFDRGTLLVDIIPTASVNDPAQRIKSAWTGVASTILTGSITQAGINAAIDEMFAQSPYLVPGTAIPTPY